MAAMDQELLHAIANGRPGAVLATVIQVKGSAPRGPGAKLLLPAQGPSLGSVGGGRGEAMTLEACRGAAGTGRPVLLQVDMTGEDVTGSAMVCGGTSLILVEPLADLAPYRRALQCLDRGERALLVKRIAVADPVRVDTGLAGEGGASLLDPAFEPAAAARALDAGQPRYDPEAGLFLDPLLPREKLLILGGGHVGRALAALAPSLGLEVTVVDDRADYLAPDRFPQGVRTLQAGFREAVAGFPFDRATYAVIVTRGHQHDLDCARAVLGRPYRYAGLMGSARKVRFILEQLVLEGHDQAQVDALCAPIGLDIGAETPEELAIAILGELVAVRRSPATVAALRAARAVRRQKGQ
jgi:xanthine dehydrogenase accessory factor